MDWPATTAIAAIFTAIATGTMAVPTLLKGIGRIVAWHRRNSLYRRLEPLDLDILKAISESGTTRISLYYGDLGDSPQMDDTADRILGIAVRCRLNVNESYQPSLARLVEHGLLGVDPWPWRYAPYRAVANYKTTEEGRLFLCKYTSGMHWAEKAIRRYFKGLRRHKFKGGCHGEVCETERDRLPFELRAEARHERYDAASLGTHPLGLARLYEYPPGARQDQLECMVVIAGDVCGVSSNDLVFLLFDPDSQPLYMARDQETSRLTGSYIVRSEVIDVKETEPRGETVLFLCGAQTHDATS